MKKTLRAAQSVSVSAKEKLGLFFRAAEQNPATIVITDSDGMIVYVNEKFTALTGYARKEVIGKNPRILQSGRHSRAFYRRMWSKLARGEDWKGRLCNRTKGGRLYWESALITSLKDEKGKITHLLAIKEDISSRKRSEERIKRYKAQLEETVDERTDKLRRNVARQRRTVRKLRAAEFRFRTVADYSLNWVYWRQPDGTFEYISPSVKRFTGFSAEEFEQDPGLLEKIILREDLAAWEDHHRRTAGHDTERHLILRIKNRSGATRWFEHTCRPVWGANRKYSGVRADNRDITDEKLSEIEFLKQRQEIERVSRLVSLGELTAALSHQLNQPLTAILSNAQAGRFLIGLTTPDLGEVKTILEEIAEESGRAGLIITRMRDLIQNRADSGHSLDLNKAVLSTVALLKDGASVQNISLETDLDPRLAPVGLDRILFQQILVNLITNGFDALAEVDLDPKRIGIRTRIADGQAARVDVQDNGPGFSDTSLGHGFEAFRSTKPGGLGIGLSVCKRIVEAVGGRIWIGNDPRGGAIVSMILPFAKGGAV